MIDLSTKEMMPYSSLLTVRLVTNINEITNYNTKIESNPDFFTFDLRGKKQGEKEKNKGERKVSSVWLG